MEEQRDRARKAQKKEEISVEEGELECSSRQNSLDTIFSRPSQSLRPFCQAKKQDELNIVLDRTPFYAEMGGQVGDRGLLHVPGHDRTEIGQLACDRHAKARRRFYSSREDNGRAGARAGRSGARFGRCRSAPCDSGTSHSYPFVALGVARSCLMRCGAKRKLRWPGQTDVRFFKRGISRSSKSATLKNW